MAAWPCYRRTVLAQNAQPLVTLMQTYAGYITGSICNGSRGHMRITGSVCNGSRGHTLELRCGASVLTFHRERVRSLRTLRSMI